MVDGAAARVGMVETVTVGAAKAAADAPATAEPTRWAPKAASLDGLPAPARALVAVGAGGGAIVATAVVAAAVSSLTRPLLSPNWVGFWSVVVGTAIVPRFEEIEALWFTGELPPSNKRLVRRATPLMKFWFYAGVVVNAWWLWRLVDEHSKEDVAFHLAMALMLTDVVSGLYHWFQDSYRSKDEKINVALFDNFQIHHEVPYLICKHDAEYISWELAAGCLVGHALAEIHAVVEGGYSGFFFGFRTFWIFGTWINQVHRWAHAPLGKGISVPWPLQSRTHHAMHHERPELKSYCIFSVLNNWWLDALRVWEGIEWLIFKGFGAVSFRMAVNDPERYQRASNFSLDDVIREREEREKFRAQAAAEAGAG